MRALWLLFILYIPFFLQGQDPDKAKKLYDLGRTAFEKKQFEDAEDYFEEAIDQNDQVADYHYWYGAAMGEIAKDANIMTQGMMAPKIKEAFEKTVQLDPKNLEAYWGLVEFYTHAPGFMGGSWQKADETARTIMKIKKAEGYRALGVVNERQDKWSEAETNFMQAYHHDVSYYNHLSNFYIRRKQYDKAFAITEEAIKRNQEDMLAAYQMGRICAASGQKLDVGESCLIKYLAYQPKADEPRHAAANMRLAQIKEKKGNKPEAKKFYEAALKLDPSMKEAKEGLARVRD